MDRSASFSQSLDAVELGRHRQAEQKLDDLDELLACQRAFCFVSQKTAQLELCFFRQPALASWEKVLELQTTQDKPLRTETVAAALTGRFPNPACQFNGYINSDHINSGGVADRGSPPS
jgi:hypothetical protein